MTALSEVDRTSSETLGGDDSVQIPDLMDIFRSENEEKDLCDGTRPGVSSCGEDSPALASGDIAGTIGPEAQAPDDLEKLPVYTKYHIQKISNNSRAEEDKKELTLFAAVTTK